MELRKCLERRGGPDLSRGFCSTYVGYTLYTELYELFISVCTRTRKELRELNRQLHMKVYEFVTV